MVQERPVRVERRLSAILAADVAGYSRLMHSDEEATHIKLTSLLTDAVDPSVAEHGGRVVKNTGDGFLAEFPSAVEAVRAAVEFQTRVKELTTAEAEYRRIAFRVGINVGDVIVEPHDIFGDDVNIAARLESIAEPGGICISSSAYDHVRGKVGVEFVDLGEQNLKNIHRPVRAYAVVRARSSPATQVESARPGPFSPPRLSIVVLPFANLSGDLQDYFVDGITENLTTDLSRIRGSFVIGRHTAFAYKGKAVDLKQVGWELNVRYVLEGSVQRGGDRLRVNVQLVDTETRAHVWADRFDKPVADLFYMQDEIVSRLANTLNAQLIAEEAKRSKRSLHPDSMDLFFQGRASWNKGWALAAKKTAKKAAKKSAPKKAAKKSPAKKKPATPRLAEARRFFERALKLDPENIDAMVCLAGVDLAVARSYLTDDRDARLRAAEAGLEKALSLAPDHAEGHLTLGGVQIVTNRAADGIVTCERALALDRNLAEAHGMIGDAKYFLGRGAETEAHMNEALRLSPQDFFAFRWLMVTGFAKLQVTADDEAVVWFRRSIDANRNYPIAHFGRAAALALLGSSDLAKVAAKNGLRLDPSFTIRRFRDSARSNIPTYLAKRERVYEGMRMAGVPKG